jgi:nucleotide-binding universal stress UspA family protein
MDTQPDGSVVVGIDLTSESRRTADEGIRQARLLQRPLHLVFATGLGLVSSARAYLADKEEELRRHAQQALELAPDLEVTHEVRVADPAETLVEASRTARLLVVGSAGLPRAADALRDATTRKVVHHSSCPVMVVPHAGVWDGEGPVVVGVDGSEHSGPALDWAFDVACRSGAPLIPVHAWWWQPPMADLSVGVLDGATEEIEEAERRALSEGLAPWRERYPDVVIAPTLVHGRAEVALADMSSTARTVVVGSRGRGGFTGLLLGSVSDHLAHHARCPVVIVPSASAR